MSKGIQKLFKHFAQNHQMKAIQTEKLYGLLYTDYIGSTNPLLTMKKSNKTDVLVKFRKSYRSHKEGLCGKNVCRPAALDEPSLCQMLDTACVSGVLLKNDRICMTKADGFRVRSREGEGGGGSEGRQETDCDSWTDALGSLALSQSGEQKLCRTCWILKLRHWMRSVDIFGFDHTSHGVCSQITQRYFLLLWRKMGILQLRVQQ